MAGGLYGAAATGTTSEDTIERLRRFGERAGLAFQIVDDVLDMTEDSAQLGKTAGKDTASDKATWPAVYGIERSQEDAKQLIADAFTQGRCIEAARDVERRCQVDEDIRLFGESVVRQTRTTGNEELRGEHLIARLVRHGLKIVAN